MTSVQANPAAFAPHDRFCIPAPKRVRAVVDVHPHVSGSDQHVSNSDPYLKRGCAND